MLTSATRRRPSLTSIVEPARPYERAGRTLRLTAGITLGLLFLSGPASDLAGSSTQAWQRTAIWACFALFVVLYAAVMRGSPLAVHPGGTLAVLAGLVLLPSAMLALGAPSSVELLFVFFVAAAGMRLHERAAWVTILATAAGVGIGDVVSGEGSSAANARVLTIFALGAMMTAFNRQIRANRELRAAREELARLAVTDERLRIARDLHDLLGHSLSVINLKSELAGRLVHEEPDRAAAELSDVQSVGRQALAEVREAVQGYRQLSLEDALAGARSALAAAGIEYDIDEPPALPPEVDEVFAWAVREATTNVVRHSGAGRCAVRIRDDAGEAVVEVEDDGSFRAQQPDTGSGLAGLAERADRVRGRLDAGVAPGGGFCLRLVVPLPA